MKSFWSSVRAADSTALFRSIVGVLATGYLLFRFDRAETAVRF